MDLLEVKNLITESKNIYIIPSDNNESGSIANALALFYTLKELNKNVNLIIEDFPEKFKFLIPSLDFISYPKNFIISVPKKLADVSQIYYEKNEEGIKIHLTLDKGNIKKEDLSFYFSETKPDLIITIGVQSFKKQLLEKLDSFGFLMDSPVLNIDNEQKNENFGKINLIGSNSLSQITQKVIEGINPELIKSNTATCLLTGHILYSNNFQNSKTTPELLENSADLIKKGALHKTITDNLYKLSPTNANFVGQIFKNLNFDQSSKLSFATLNSSEFENFGQREAEFAIKHINPPSLGFENLLVLWESHASLPKTKGFFYSSNQENINKISQTFGGELGSNYVFISVEEPNPSLAKEKIFKSLLS